MVKGVGRKWLWLSGQMLGGRDFLESCETVIKKGNMYGDKTIEVLSFSSLLCKRAFDLLSALLISYVNLCGLARLWRSVVEASKVGRRAFRAQGWCYAAACPHHRFLCHQLSASSLGSWCASLILHQPKRIPTCLPVFRFWLQR